MSDGDTTRSRVSRGGGSRATGKPRGQGWKRKAEEAAQVSEPEDGEQCLICANTIKYAALSPCNHITCHVCAFRQRVLYDKKACLVCRTENDRVIVSDQIDKQYGDFSAQDITKVNDKYDIDFTSQKAYDVTLALLKNDCDVCHKLFPNFKELTDHAKTDHNKYYCIICSKNKKAFVIELKLYNYKQLQKHLTEGDDDGFKGHPECKYCRGKRFYSEDELNIHIRDRHERCHICDQDNPKNASYYRNYDDLYSHFRHEHYVCSVPSCVEKRFVVFREDLDLTAHMLKEHGGLTGLNGKVVIGNTSRQFQSQLSTFRGGRGNDSEESDSYDLKKKRLEERAKHYLEYKAPEIKKFTDLNSGYRSRKISAKELVNGYKELFTSKDADISILLLEFSELFPESSEHYRNLVTASSEYQGSLHHEQFPALGGKSNGLANFSGSWGGSGSKKTAGEKFPMLPKLEKAKPVVKAGASIRYTTVVKKQQKPVNIQISTSQASSNYRPNYLSNISNKPSTSSLPILGSNTSSASSSTSDLSSLSRTGSPSKILTEKFPALQKKPTRKVFPMENPNQKQSVWGGSTPEPAPAPSNDDWGIPISDKRKQKMKKKQEKILFQT